LSHLNVPPFGFFTFFFPFPIGKSCFSQEILSLYETFDRFDALNKTMERMLCMELLPLFFVTFTIVLAVNLFLDKMIMNRQMTRPVLLTNLFICFLISLVLANIFYLQSLMS